MSVRHKPLPLELWSERDLSSAVVELARLGGWKRYHTFDAKRSNRGFPDWVFVKGPRLIFAELKSESGKLRPEQVEWVEALAVVAGGVSDQNARVDHYAGVMAPLQEDAPRDPTVEVYVWRPSDLEEIAAILTGRKAA